ncbi:MAG TPA: alanine racemase [Acidimicrobiales bacterium]
MTGADDPADTRADQRAVAARVAEARARIDAAAPDPSSVRLVAVTKGFGVDAVAAALAAGVFDVGENYADELVSKAEALQVTAPGGTGPAPTGQAATWQAATGPDVRWHYLGAIQRNKVARLAPLVDCWQSVARIEEGRAIARRRPGASVLVQVDVVGGKGRNGCPPEEVSGLVAALGDEELDVVGLMTIGPMGPAEASRPAFALVRALATRLGLAECSMGMTDDMDVALSEGSTMVRLGRALFGERPRRDGG